MKFLIAAFVFLGLSGCATLDGVALDNRLACTVAGDQLHVISQYGPVGIASRISDKDRAVVCGAK